MHTSLLRGRSPCNLTLPVINYLPWRSPFTVNAQKAPIASLWAIKASIGWYQTTLTSSNLSCHCHLLKGLHHFVPRVPLLSVCMAQAGVHFTGHWPISEFYPEQYKQGQRSTGLEVFLLYVFEQCLQLVKYSPVHSKLRLCHFMTTLLSHWTDYFHPSWWPPQPSYHVCHIHSV